MTFRATVKTTDGDRLTIVREAESTASLSALLKSEGMLLLSAEAVKSAERTNGSRGFGLPMSGFEVEVGLRQLSSMLRSGVPILSALESVSEQSGSRRARQNWTAIREDIAAGSTFAGALKPFEKKFGPVTIALVEVGERTGELDRALARAAEQLEAKRNLRMTVVNALAYPSVTVLLAIGVSAFLVVAVIPKIAEFLRGGGAQLPPITRMLVDVSEWTVANGLPLLAGIFGAVALWLLGSLFERTREIEDVIKLRLPVAGKILRFSATSLFARSMEIMLGSGVTLLDSMSVAARLLVNRRCRRRIVAAREEVIRGIPLGAALKTAKEFPPMLSQMAAIGEMTGSLAESFDETARLHEMMLAVAIKRFSVLIEPVMIGIVGGIVGFVYIAFFMALFAMASVN